MLFVLRWQLKKVWPKGSWHDQPKEETNVTQASASRVKIAGLMRKTSLKRSWSLKQAKTSQILTIQHCLLKKIMLPSLGSAFFVCLCFFFSFPHLYSVLNFKKENVTVKFPRRSYFSLWAVWVPSFHWMAAYPVDRQASHVYKSSNVENSQLFFTRIPGLVLSL